MHLNSVSEGIELNSEVHEGQQIGTIGGTAYGSIKGRKPHLHYELFINGEYADPTNGKDHLIDPQRLINGGLNDNRVYQGGSLQEIQVVAPKSNKPSQLIVPVPTPKLPNQIQINF